MTSGCGMHNGWGDDDDNGDGSCGLVEDVTALAMTVLVIDGGYGSDNNIGGDSNS